MFLLQRQPVIGFLLSSGAPLPAYAARRGKQTPTTQLVAIILPSVIGGFFGLLLLYFWISRFRSRRAEKKEKERIDKLIEERLHQEGTVPRAPFKWPIPSIDTDVVDAKVVSQAQNFNAPAAQDSSLTSPPRITTPPPAHGPTIRVA